MVMFIPDEIPIGSSYRTVADKHIAELKRHVPEQEDRIWLAVAELRAYTDYESAKEAFNRASPKSRQTEIGQAVADVIECRKQLSLMTRNEDNWYAEVDAIMRSSIETGQCKLSRSGNSVIFSKPQRGRSDLSSRIDFAVAQLIDAGIPVPRPDIALRNPDPAYLRSLIERSGLTQQEAAERIGISDRAMRNYLSIGAERPAPYSVQYALEQLAK